MIIGITGKKQSGKSTFATALRGCLGWDNLSVLSIAEPIYWAYNEMYGEEVSEGHGPLNADGRQIMQGMSDTAKAMVGDEILCDIVAVKAIMVQPRHIIIPNIRFPFEDDYFQDLAQALHTTYYSVRVIREGQVSDDDHPTETEQDKIVVDFTVTAKSGDLERLEREAYAIGNQIKEGGGR